MSLSVCIPVLLSFLVSVLLGPVIIPFLKRLKAGQTIRDEGPKSHLKKNGTPTMGGILILSAMIVTSLFYMKDYPKINPILLLTLGFGLIGFLDDYIKVILKRSMGLTPLQKMAGQLVVTSLFAYYLLKVTDISLAAKIPFMPGVELDLGWLNIPLLFFIIIGTVNGANFTDGLDGLAASVTVLAASFLSAAAIGTGTRIEPITCAVAGALMGFLLFNVYPASVFMGDTGSLALGGFVAASAYMMQLQLFIPIIAFIYVIEVVSVILQVVYFKVTGGKRLFRMAPLHHHFELGGWSETRIVAVFSIITAILCLVALIAM
ncbi:phospho-N-acetylmuramoyl-pentapeptide-transferase [Eisenbergiella tayi]|uniref:Phospho-N-acetylmuramoyl-pentapeptide-transferase n=1 Tax=Eisenbergiella tayi TaxID=1432052 RepID=A0A1E3UCH0_9FIRM|nr:phospho-N-acetylmuramoyl-pentapeptide-transferase [Eisenbergiella tayi]ODR45615.1 phospho-N-acetylmuramoyl-pentapeptide-transferase [Eisenbergiella tayi]